MKMSVFRVSDVTKVASFVGLLLGTRLSCG